VAAAPGYAGTGADFDDVPLLFAEAIHTADQNAQPWAVVSEDSKKKKESKAKSRLNSEIIQGMTPVLLTQADPTDEIRRWLRTVGATLNA
jgi:hypothetical protein